MKGGLIKVENWIDVALPKGRLGENVYKIFEEAGYSCPSILETNRKLIFENEEKQDKIFLGSNLPMWQYM